MQRHSITPRRRQYRDPWAYFSPLSVCSSVCFFIDKMTVFTSNFTNVRAIQCLKLKIKGQCHGVIAYQRCTLAFACKRYDPYLKGGTEPCLVLWMKNDVRLAIVHVRHWHKGPILSISKSPSRTSHKFKKHTKNKLTETQLMQYCTYYLLTLTNLLKFIVRNVKVKNYTFQWVSRDSSRVIWSHHPRSYSSLTMSQRNIKWQRTEPDLARLFVFQCILVHFTFTILRVYLYIGVQIICRVLRASALEINSRPCLYSSQTAIGDYACKNHIRLATKNIRGPDTIEQKYKII